MGLDLNPFDGDGIGYSEDGDGGSDTDGGGFSISNAQLGGTLLFGLPGLLAGTAIDELGNMLKPPDYGKPLDAAQKALDDEKRRRAMEANRQDMQASQLARLFLSNNGAQEETFNFMGL